MVLSIGDLDSSISEFDSHLPDKKYGVLVLMVTYVTVYDELSVRIRDIPLKVHFYYLIYNKNNLNL